MANSMHRAGLVTGLIIFLPAIVIAASVISLMDWMSKVGGNFGTGIKHALDYTQYLLTDEEDLLLKYGDD